MAPSVWRGSLRTLILLFRNEQNSVTFSLIWCENDKSIATSCISHCSFKGRSEQTNSVKRYYTKRNSLCFNWHIRLSWKGSRIIFYLQERLMACLRKIVDNCQSSNFWKIKTLLDFWCWLMMKMWWICGLIRFVAYDFYQQHIKCIFAPNLLNVDLTCHVMLKCYALNRMVTNDSRDAMFYLPVCFLYVYAYIWIGA